MPTRLAYAVKYVADMDRAVAFHRDQLGLSLRFASPEWTEFDTGSTTLALHAATPDKPAGHVELGFAVDDLVAFHREKDGHGVTFTQAPKELHGTRLAAFLDSEGAVNGLSG